MIINKQTTSSKLNEMSVAAKAAIESARLEAETKLTEYLPNAHQSVFTFPLKCFSLMAEAAKKDVDDIVAMSQGDCGQFLDSSVAFWVEKIKNVLHPYTIAPGNIYDGVIINDIVRESPQNTTEAYKKAEAEINKAFEKAISEVEKKFKGGLEAQKPTSIEDVTKTNWIRFHIIKAYRDALRDFEAYQHEAKVSADKGDIEESLRNMHSNIEQTKSHFDTNLEYAKEIPMDALF